MRSLVLAAICLAFSIAPLSAEVITRCGPPKGYANYFDFLSKGGEGWRQDGISDGGLELIRDGEKYDVVGTNAIGDTTSQRSDGYQIVRVPQLDPALLMLVGVNPSEGEAEHFLFKLDKSGRGSVLWGYVRGGESIAPKGHLFLSQCSR